MGQGMSDSPAQAVHPHDSKRGREPKAGFLGMVAFDVSVKEPRKKTGKARPGT